MSDDLQTDLKRFDADHYYKPEHWKRIAEAARLVANLRKEIDLHRLSDGLKFAHITDSDGDYLIHVAQQVQTAFAPPGDTK